MTTLERVVDSYQLDVDGIRFWTPYWINWSTDEFHFNAPYRGKGTALQLQQVLQRRLKEDHLTLSTGQDARTKMRSYGLGVDCSGFAYHLLQAYLSARRLGPLSQRLLISQSEIEQARQRHPGRSQVFRGNGPITLAAVARAWHRNPVAWTHVQRLTDNHVTEIIEACSDIRPGHVIKLTGSDNQDHIAVVIRTTKTAIDYAQSIYRSNTLGGVEIQRILVNDWARGIESQDWSDKHLFHYDQGDRVRALRNINY